MTVYHLLSVPGTSWRPFTFSILWTN